MAPTIGTMAKATGGSHAAKMVKPATYGDIMEPTRETVEEAPIAMLRATVGNISVVYMYLKE